MVAPQERRAGPETSGLADEPIKLARMARRITLVTPAGDLQVRRKRLEVLVSFADRGSQHFKAINADAKAVGYKLREIDYVGTHASIQYVDLANPRKRYSATVPLDHQNNAAPGILSEMRARRSAESE